LRVLAGCLALIAFIAGAARVPAGAAIEAGRAFPQTTFVARDGSTYDLPDAGAKPTLLVFFASWCGPCREEMPRIIGSYRHYGERLRFIGIDLFEPDAKAAAFASDLHVPFPVVTLSTTEAGLFGKNGIKLPMSILVADTGIVRDIWFGYDDHGPGPFFGHLVKVGIRN
jgi:thiol-disulfide isomerase/thioredoxin